MRGIRQDIYRAVMAGSAIALLIAAWFAEWGDIIFGAAPR